MATTAKSPKVDMFGINIQKLIAMLKDEPSVHPVAMEDAPAVLLVQTPFTITRTLAHESLVAKFPHKTEEYAVKRARNGWAKFESEQAQARLHLTNVLIEDANGKLVRKLVSEDGAQVWVQKSYLDIFEAEAIALSRFVFESIPYYSHEIDHCPVRISLKEGYASGYTMPFIHLKEQVYK